MATCPPSPGTGGWRPVLTGVADVRDAATVLGWEAPFDAEELPRTWTRPARTRPRSGRRWRCGCWRTWWPGFSAVGPNASPYPADSRGSTEASNRLVALRELHRQRTDELRFLGLRTAADEEIRGRLGEEPLGTDRLLLHTAALISLGEAQDALRPFDRAAALLEQDALPVVGTTLEQLARIRIAAGPARERDEVLARLRRTAPQSMVPARLHQPTLLERNMHEQEARFEALLLDTEVERGQQSLREPLEQLRLRARASEHPEPYREALAHHGGQGRNGGAPRWMTRSWRRRLCRSRCGPCRRPRTTRCSTSSGRCRPAGTTRRRRSCGSTRRRSAPTGRWPSWRCSSPSAARPWGRGSPPPGSGAVPAAARDSPGCCAAPARPRGCWAPTGCWRNTVTCFRTSRCGC